MCVVADGPSGKGLHSSGLSQTENSLEIIDRREDIAEARASLLAGPLPTRAEITGGVCTAYGLTTWGHLFTDRQILALLTTSDLIQADPSADPYGCRARGIVAYGRHPLRASGSHFFGACCRPLCRLQQQSLPMEPIDQKVMNFFGKQAIPMVFDFAEANFLGNSVGAWKTCSDYVSDCVEVISVGEAELAKRGNLTLR